VAGFFEKVDLMLRVLNTYTKKLLGMTDMFITLIVVMVSWVYAYDRLIRLYIYIKSMSC